MGLSKQHVSLKEKAISLRLTGQSYREISNTLSVNRSTLSGWLKNIPLSTDHRQKLITQWKNGLIKARERSIQVKNAEKIQNIQLHQKNAENFLKNINLDNAILELFLAGLYLGDGFKTNGRLGLGNANPQLVLLFTNLIRKLYQIDETKLHVEIFGRADQRPIELIDYWSKLLIIPKNQFQHTQLDPRSIKPTRPNYHGVCAVNYNDVNLQRRILAIGEEMLKYK